MSVPRKSQSFFFPKAEADVLKSNYELPTSRPEIIDPILDNASKERPIEAYMSNMDSIYPLRTQEYAPALIPEEPECLADFYLQPLLARNERLRLTMIWYYTRHVLNDLELLSRLQEKVHLVAETIGWEFVIIGLLDINKYTRIATFGLPLAILPRRESTCAHTINQPPGTVFLLPNMVDDWRFRKSPHVDIGGLRAYAGVPLRLDTEFGDTIAMGSLCVASNEQREPLTKSQQISLARIADWVVGDIVHSARVNRQKERRKMVDLVSRAQEQANDDHAESFVLDILRTTYPSAVISVQHTENSEIVLDDDRRIAISQLEGNFWEDGEHLDDIIRSLNHQDTIDSTRTLRIIAAQCENPSTPTFLLVASKDLRLVFDDVDSWFVQTCANIISRIWHTQLLREALKAKDKFLRGVTHQLRTPIHGIIASADLLAEELITQGVLDVMPSPTPSPLVTPTLEPIAAAYINAIRNSGRDLISTVNSMITLNRWTEITTAQHVNEMHLISDLEQELLADTMREISGDSRYAPSVFFVHELSTTCDSISIDLSLLKDCIRPLILNAVQSTSMGVVAIRISSCSDLKDLIIDIEDNGCGIAAHDQERIFSAYEKVDIHSTGAGLGLTLACKYATLLNGSVELVKSAPTLGSHFRARFRNVVYACSQTARISSFQHFRWLPTTFYRYTQATNSLSEHFARFLSQQNIIPSETAENSIIILDRPQDVMSRNQIYARIPADQVGICLVSASDTMADYDNIPSNMFYVRSPFLTSKLMAVLEQANAVLASRLSSFNSSGTTPTPSIRIAESVHDDNAQLVDEAASDVPNAPQNDHLETETAGTLELLKSLEITSSTPLPQHELDAPPIPPPLPRISSKPRALLVDDNAVNLKIMSMYCKKRNLAYERATDGQQAIATFSAHQTSAIEFNTPLLELILMDLQMPVCDGLKATQQIRELEIKHNWPRCIILIVTGQDSPSDRIDAENTGADGFHVKPVRIPTLDFVVKQHFPLFLTT